MNIDNPIIAYLLNIACYLIIRELGSYITGFLVKKGMKSALIGAKGENIQSSWLWTDNRHNGIGKDMCVAIHTSGWEARHCDIEMHGVCYATGEQSKYWTTHKARYFKESRFLAI